MKFEKLFYQNNQRKKLYKVWYERDFSEYVVSFGSLLMELPCILSNTLYLPIYLYNRFYFKQRWKQIYLWLLIVSLSQTYFVYLLHFNSSKKNSFICSMNVHSGIPFECVLYKHIHLSKRYSYLLKGWINTMI